MSRASTAQTILSVGRRLGATPKSLLAALETGLVESGLRNLPYGLDDSVGVFQQRPSQGWTGLMNVPKAAEEFFAKAIPLAHKYGTAGELAQAVQHSGHPERYGQRRGEALSFLHGVGSGPHDSGTATPRTVSATVTQPAVQQPSLDAPVPDSSGLLAMLGQQQAPQPVSVPDPSFSANRYLKSAGTPLTMPTAQQQGPDFGSLLATLGSQGQELPDAPVQGPQTSVVTAQAPREDATPDTPIRGPGLQLPTSFQTTHQTAGLAGYPARDIFAKPGTPVRAPVSGTVVKLSGHAPSAGAVQGQGGPFGLSTYIKGPNGTYFMTHFGSRNVRVGQKVRKGQVIGTVGDYPGGTPDHIHEGLSRR